MKTIFKYNYNQLYFNRNIYKNFNSLASNTNTNTNISNISNTINQPTLIKSETPILMTNFVNPFHNNNENEVPMWAYKPFSTNKDITLPIFNLKNKNFSGHNFLLPQSIFNQAIRKDIIHKVYTYNTLFNKKVIKPTLTKGEVAGSGKKVRPQKGSGKSRQGNIRSPQLRGGGKAHGRKIRNFYFPLNKKVRLLGLKCMLTSKLRDNKIILFENIDFKNIQIADTISKFLEGNRATVYFNNDDDENAFKISKRKCKNMCLDPSNNKEFNVKKLIDNKFLILSNDTLSYLIDMLVEREERYFEFKKFKKDDNHKPLLKEKYNFNFDVTKDLKIYTPSLSGSQNNIIKAVLNPEELKETMYKRADKDAEARIKKVSRRVTRKLEIRELAKIGKKTKK